MYGYYNRKILPGAPEASTQATGGDLTSGESTPFTFPRTMRRILIGVAATYGGIMNINLNADSAAATHPDFQLDASHVGPIIIDAVDTNKLAIYSVGAAGTYGTDFWVKGWS